jgi:chromosome partitioning protein
MRTIALVTQKGGSGKSTLAACLAVAAQQAGEKVFILDMDPQGSLLKWSKARGERDIPVEAIPANKLPSALTALAKNEFTLAIIDTAGTDAPATAAAMKSADLCIIPTRPTVFDLWASEVTRKSLRTLKKEYVFLLNQCPASHDSERVKDGAKALEAMGGLLTPLIASRVDYQEAAKHGLGVTELSPSSRAAEEMHDLWKSLRRKLAKLMHDGRAKKVA